jgi:hypothetical protein
MLTQKFRDLLEEFHRKKWFPEKYPDPYGEFIDYISEGMVSDLYEAWQKEKRGAYLDVARYILQLLVQIRYRELWKDYKKSLTEKLSGTILPESISFYVRTSPDQEAAELWKKFQSWTSRWEAVHAEWAQALIEFEIAHSKVSEADQQRLSIGAIPDNHLRATRELFAWKMQTKTKAKNYLELQRYFQLTEWRTVTDWSDLSGLAKAVVETCGNLKLPVLQEAQNPAAQFLFPIRPPVRVILEHGNSHSPFDAIRFLQELGKALFFKGMNPSLNSEERLCGDPSLVWFWGYLFGSLLSDSNGIKHFVGLRAEGMEQHTQFVSECLYRHECCLTLYRSGAGTEWKNLEDQYASRWEEAYPLETPRFLYLFELIHSTDSIYRASALRRSQHLVKHLQTKYGKKWFASPRWIRRVREYWWEGFRMTTKDVLGDLGVEDSVEWFAG